MAFGVTFSRRIVESRRVVLAGLALTTVAFAGFIPSVEVRFEPEELVAPDELPDVDADLLPADEPLVVVVEADDVLAPPVLAYIHTLSEVFVRDPAVRAVDGPTTTPLPSPTDLEAPDETLESLAELDDADVVPPAVDLLDPVLVAVGDVVAADPTRWPLGMISFAGEGRAVRVAPLVAPGEVPTARHAAALAALVERSALVGGRLVSRDRRLCVVVLSLDTAAPRSDVDAAIVRARATTSSPPDGVRVSLSGLPAIRLEMVEALRADQLRLVALAFGLSLVVLVLGTRSRAGVLVPLATVGVTVVLTLGAMGLTGEPLNLLTNMIPPLLVTIGLAEAVHLVLRWEELAGEGLDRRRAAHLALDAMALPCLVTTGTTAIGFGALVLQETTILRHFGIIAATASMLVYLITVLLVPAALPSFVPRAEADRAPSRGWLERALVEIARLTGRRAAATILGSTLVLVGALLVARDLRVDSMLMDQFARGSSVARTTRALERHLDGVRSLEVVLAAAPGHFATPEGMADVLHVSEWLRAQPGVLRATSLGDWLLEARRVVRGDEELGAPTFASSREIAALRRMLVATAGVGRDGTAGLVSEDGARARIEVRLADRGASRILAMLDDLTGEIARRPGLEGRFAGEAVLASRGLDRIVRSLGSLSAAVTLIFIVMTLLFRSLRLGLISIPPNALPIALTLAYMVVRGIALNAATVIVFTVSIGLAVDGATHVIARFREEALRADVDAAELVRRTVVSSGRGVMLASATLLLGYGALLTSAFEPIRLFGELSAVAIAGSLVAQVVLLPALLAAFARPRPR